MKRSGRVVATARSSALTPGPTTGQRGCTSTDSDAGHLAWVQIDSLGACRQCARGSGCGVSMLSPSTPGVRLLCSSVVPVVESDAVTVDIQEPAASWLPLVVCAYGLPLLGLLFGTIFGTFMGSILSDASVGHLGQWDGSTSAVPDSSAIMQEVFSILCAVAGLFGGLFAWRKVSQPLGAWIETGLCLDTARIVAVGPESMESEA